MIVNNFEVNQENQYNLEEGRKLNTCPLCSEHRKPANQKKKVLMCDWKTGIGTCQHCGEVVQLHTYKKKKAERVYVKPPFKNKTELSDKMVKWFEGRGISQLSLKKLKVSEGPEWMSQTGQKENTIQFNYFRDDELVNIKYRDGRKNFKLFKDAEKIFYNLDNIRTTTEAIIVEGEMDVLSFVEAGLNNVVSVPNGSTKGNVNLEYLDNCIDYLDNKEKIYLALDDDEAGRNVQGEMIRRLGAERCFIVDLKGLKDANDVLLKLGGRALIEAIKTANRCPLENVVKFNDVKEQLRDFYLNGSAPGYQIGIVDFDRVFSTYTSQFIVVTGVPSSGKSDFVDQMAVGYNLNYGWKTAYCSPENKPEYLHADKICRKLAGFRPSNLVELDSVGWKTVEDHMDENFFFIDYTKGYSLKEVLKKGAELVKRKGIKCLVLDPFNKIHLKESNRADTNQYTNDYLNEIDIFCKLYDVLVILVAHPVKMKKLNGITPEPDFYDIKGGGEFYDMSYHGLLVHRNYDNKSVKIKVLKVKFQNLGENQAEVHKMWNPHNGRYSDIKGDNSNWLDRAPVQESITYDTDPMSAFDNLNAFENETAPF